MDDYTNQVASLIRQRILASPLPQKEVARRAGLGASSLSQIARGKQDITVGQINRIARALDLSPWHLLPGGSPDLPLVSAARVALPLVRYVAGEVGESALPHHATYKRMARNLRTVLEQYLVGDRP
jgi:transcriptional regulator with XRE-family HTH domain